jgi:hypothetical protein
MITGSPENSFVVTKINSTDPLTPFVSMQYRPGNLKNCKGILWDQGGSIIEGRTSLLLLCFEGNSMNSSSPVLFGHLFRVLTEVIIWDWKINLSKCLASEIQNIIDQRMTYYVENYQIYLNFPLNVYRFNMYTFECKQFPMGMMKDELKSIYPLTGNYYIV